jgi:hypothetical protein
MWRLGSGTSRNIDPGVPQFEHFSLWSLMMLIVIAAVATLCSIAGLGTFILLEFDSEAPSDARNSRPRQHPNTHRHSTPAA